MRFLLFAMLMAFTPAAVSAQAFGVQVGDPVGKYSGRHSPGVADEYYFSITVPQPNSEFESYSALATPQTGICKVTGLGKTHYEEDGTETRAAFANLSDTLGTRYGEAKKFNFLHSGALWDKPSEWGWSVYKKERTLASFWIREKGANLPAGVNAITLEVRAIGPSKTYVTLAYEFTNIDACLAVRGKKDDAGL